MDVRPGYKQTEVGVIPVDWNVQTLSPLVKTGPKNRYSGRSAKDARGTPTLTLGATTSGALILNDETVKRLEETIDSASELFLQRGDVLVQRSNTTDLVGPTAVFDGPSGVYVYPDLMIRNSRCPRQTWGGQSSARCCLLVTAQSQAQSDRFLSESGRGITA